jgi:hypothetical protein
MEDTMTDDIETTGAGVQRRTVFGAAAATLGAAALLSRPSPAAAVTGSTDPGGLPHDLLEGFTEPGPGSAAGFRWWWPHGLVDPEEIRREVDQVADAGFGVLEIADVTHSLKARNIEIDLAGHGWGTASWVAGVRAALSRAVDRGIRIDITVGPSWPAAVSTITPDDDAAATELVHGQVTVAAGTTYAGPLPEPMVAPASSATARHLLAVQAWRVVSVVKAVTTLDPASVVDLTDQVVDGAITWSAPADGSWILLAYWRRGSGQEPEAGPHTSPRSYVVDHFSGLGSRAVIDLWNDRILDQELRSLLGAAGGCLFEDSLEIESGATIWTPSMIEEFTKRAGYDLLPVLPVVLEVKEKYVFALDPVATTRIRDDFNQVLSDLYRDNHLIPLQGFARSLGMGLRVQPYGLETDAIEHSALLDVPESESLGFKNLDDYRVMIGGRDLAGHRVLSCEAACYFGAAYQTTWERALQTINSIFAGGVNRAMLHGFAYADAPGVTWPGFAAFSPYYSGAVGYGEAWGPRMPTWQHVNDVSGYLTRTQFVLQAGTPRYDVVFLRQKGWTATGIGAPWATNVGIPQGWTHSFATPALLDLPRATVRDGRLAPDGPSYKVMIIGPDQCGGGVRRRGGPPPRRVLELAGAGLSVVLLGDWSTAEPVGLAQPGETAELRGLLAQIAALPTTRSVLVEADIPAALAALGITPDVQHDASTVMTVRRVVGDVDLYYVANAKHAENRKLVRVTQDVWLTSTRSDAVPYLLDAWSGTTTPVTLWQRRGRQVRVRVDLLPGQSTVIALGPPQDGLTPSATATTAPELRLEGRRLRVRSTAPGAYATTLADGSTVTTRIRRVREQQSLTSWTLALEDWQPGATATETIKPVRSLELSALAPWSGLPDCADVSGIGRYGTTVDLGTDWTELDGAFLDLGDVNDTFRVSVNGVRSAPCDPLDTVVDLGGLLQPGVNVIEVEVASTLINRLRTVTPAVYGSTPRQACGLAGPVRLVPYAEKPLG